ncbi:MAG: hypothetical protein M3O82_03790, partial [Verrucomicrobiota bacterium]|nr:hypothetical protein [Verrucomicrobiota bacterium]
AGSYTLLSGNSQCTPPRYDLRQLGDRLRDVTAGEPHLSAILRNPQYAQNLPRGFESGAKIDVTPWRFRKSIHLEKPGVQAIELDPDVLARAAPDFSDVRIVAGGGQLPFLVERTSIVRQIPLAATASEDREHPSLSRWLLKLPQANMPLSRITCTSNTSLFERSIRVWEKLEDERGEKYPRELGRATWRRVPDQTSREFFVQMNTTPQGDTLFVETENGDNPPIELHDFRSYYSASRLVFTSSSTLEKPVWLYYGNPEASTPRYDINLVSDALLRASRGHALPAAQENLQSRSDRVNETLSGYSRYIFFCVLGLVVVALLLLTARLLPKTT